MRKLLVSLALVLLVLLYVGRHESEATQAAPYIPLAHQPFIFPGAAVTVLGDSITQIRARGFQQEAINHWKMQYGDSFGTYVNHGVPGSTIAGLVSGGQVAAACADNPIPDIVIINSGVNSVSGSPSCASITSDVNAALAPLLGPGGCLKTGAQVWWTTLFAGHSEQHDPDPNQAAIDAVHCGIAAGAATYGSTLIDVHSQVVAYNKNYNVPAPGAATFLTTDGTHPSWLGQPFEGRILSTNVRVASPLYVDVDTDASQTLTTHRTPFVKLLAKDLPQVAGPVTSWGGYTVLSGYAAPLLKPTGWPGLQSLPGRPCVQFDGATTVMVNASISAPTGAKTFFFEYVNTADPGGFGSSSSLISFNEGGSPTLSTEYIPLFIGGARQLTQFNVDQTSSGGDGFFVIGTNDLSDSSGHMFPVRVAVTFAGGSSTDTAKYKAYWGGGTAGVVASAGFNALHSAALNALGARVDDGVTATNFYAGCVAAIVGYAGVLPTSEFYADDQILRRDYGP